MIVKTFGHLNDIRTLNPLPHAKFMFVPCGPSWVGGGTIEEKFLTIELSELRVCYERSLHTHVGCTNHRSLT